MGFVSPKTLEERFKQLVNLMDDYFDKSPEDLKNPIVQNTITDLYPEYEETLRCIFNHIDQVITPTHIYSKFVHQLIVSTLYVLGGLFRKIDLDTIDWDNLED